MDLEQLIGSANPNFQMPIGSSRFRRSASPDNLVKPFTSSHLSQMLSSLADAGLVYKNRHGKYSLVPLLGQFIQRQRSTEIVLKAL